MMKTLPITILEEDVCVGDDNLSSAQINLEQPPSNLPSSTASPAPLDQRNLNFNTVADSTCTGGAHEAAPSTVTINWEGAHAQETAAAPPPAAQCPPPHSVGASVAEGLGMNGPQPGPDWTGTVNRPAGTPEPVSAADLGVKLNKRLFFKVFKVVGPVERIDDPLLSTFWRAVCPSCTRKGRDPLAKQLFIKVGSSGRARISCVGCTQDEILAATNGRLTTADLHTEIQAGQFGVSNIGRLTDEFLKHLAKGGPSEAQLCQLHGGIADSVLNELHNRVATAEANLAAANAIERTLVIQTGWAWQPTGPDSTFAWQPIYRSAGVVPPSDSTPGSTPDSTPDSTPGSTFGGSMAEGFGRPDQANPPPSFTQHCTDTPPSPPLPVNPAHQAALQACQEACQQLAAAKQLLEHATAKQAIVQKLIDSDMIRLRHYYLDWFAYTARGWIPVTDQDIETGVRRFLDSIELVHCDGPGQVTAVEPNIRLVCEVLACLRSRCHVSSSQSQPCWLYDEVPAGYPAADRVIALRNGILPIDGPPDAALLPNRPGLFTLTRLNFDYDPAAECPTLMRCIDEWSAGEAAWGLRLQEMAGYTLIPGQLYGKIFMLCGVTRSGKSVTMRVFCHMHGKQNCISPSLQDLGCQFIGDEVSGKAIINIPDATNAGLHTKSVVGRLKVWSGGDASLRQIKSEKGCQDEVSGKIFITSNSILTLPDDSDAFSGRIVNLRYGHSFRGSEDPNLFDKLVAEAPGILRWMVEGMRRLRSQNGVFTPVQSSVEDFEDLQLQSQPVLAFIDSQCRLDRQAVRLPLHVLWTAYQDWFQASHPSGHVGNEDAFSRQLAGVPGVERCRVRIDGHRISMFGGIVILNPELSRKLHETVESRQQAQR